MCYRWKSPHSYDYTSHKLFGKAAFRKISHELHQHAIFHQASHELHPYTLYSSIQEFHQGFHLFHQYGVSSQSSHILILSWIHYIASLSAQEFSIGHSPLSAMLWNCCGYGERSKSRNSPTKFFLQIVILTCSTKRFADCHTTN